MPAKKRVLAVDDENDILLMLKTALSEDFEVQTASGGQEALSKAPDFAPNLIILDMMMPGMNGLQVLDELRKLPATTSTPVIFLTGVSDKAKIREALDKGTTYYITKPFSPYDLINKAAMAIKEAEEGR